MKASTSRFSFLCLPTFKLLVLCLLLGANGLSSNAQNLIPNPSFEVRDSCPTGWHEGFPYISTGSLFASNWFMPNAGTADYYSTCAPNPPNPGDLWVSVPENMFGYQQPRTGQAYAGGLIFRLGNESIETPLLTPTIANHRYYVGYWINLADNSVGACSRFGAYASIDSIEDEMSNVLDNYIPQIESPAGVLFLDSVGWEKVAGMYTSAGNERWLTIGSFRSINDQDTIQFMPDAGFGYGSMYYFYEDVCMLDLDGTPGDFAVNDTALCGATSLTLGGRAGMDNYYWSDGSEGRTLDISAPGVYWVNSVDLNTCKFSADTFKVTGSSTAVPFNIGNDTAICSNQDITLTATDNRFDRYEWSTGATTATINVSEPGTYTVAAFSECSTARDEIKVSLSPDCDCVFVPNAFSPNNDGANDDFKVNEVCPLRSFNLSIFNRYGERVFYTNSSFKGWDGFYGGNACDPGVYFYHLQFEVPADASTAIRELKGDLVLLR